MNADTLFKLQIRFKNLNKAQQSYEHYTKKVAHLVHERERRKARGKGEDAVHIEKMARNEEKLRTVGVVCAHLGVNDFQFSRGAHSYALVSNSP